MSKINITRINFTHIALTKLFRMENLHSKFDLVSDYISFMSVKQECKVKTDDCEKFTFPHTHYTDWTACVTRITHLLTKSLKTSYGPR